MKKIFPLLLLIFVPIIVSGNNLPDSDFDGVPDKDEIEIYHTDSTKPDSDNDGYSDWIELINGYSPLNPKPVKLEDNDYDGDGLSDRMEFNFHTDITKKDTDGDGYSDKDEIDNGYDPLQAGNEKLEKRIEINLANQKLSYFLGGVRMDTFPISSGLPSMPTPKGFFNVDGKHPRAWSSYGLWMPWWMSLHNGRFGIHELPEWPSGYKEGAGHLGKPVSHGCIRLGVGPAEFLYNWTPIGTEVYIY